MSTKLPPKILFIFQPGIDRSCLTAALIRLLLIMTIICLPIILLQDYLLLIAALFILGCWFTVDYFSQPQKILLLEDRLVLVSIFARINLFYDNIRFVQTAEISQTRLLKRNLPGFQFWGRRGWFRSKTLDNIFLFSLSGRITDHILIKYSADYYLISVKNPEVIIEKLEERINRL